MEKRELTRNDGKKYIIRAGEMAQKLRAFPNLLLFQRPEFQFLAPMLGSHNYLQFRSRVASVNGKLDSFEGMNFQYFLNNPIGHLSSSMLDKL